MTVRTLISIIIGLVLLGVFIFGSVIFIRSKIEHPGGPGATTNPMLKIDLAPTNSPDGAATATQSPNKGFTSNGVLFTFPTNWGVLECTNSQNFELDPANTNDQKVGCDVAQKPVTVLVNTTTSCPGDTVKIGNVNVTKSRVDDGTSVDYRWCFNSGGNRYDVTHRVAKDGGRATSTSDFSADIEKMIGRLSPINGGS